jgi:NADH pyrophosphatase-like rudimentary NUDIX domain
MAAKLPPPVYTEFPLDRATHLRKGNPTLLTQPAANTSLLLLHSGAVLCHGLSVNGATEPASTSSAPHTTAFRLAVSSPSDAIRNALAPELPAVFLGTADCASWFAAEVAEASTAEAAYAAQAAQQRGNGGAGEHEHLGGKRKSRDAPADGALEWVNVRKRGAELSTADSALAATAVGVLAWHGKQRHAPESGAACAAEAGGWALRGGPDERCVAACLPVLGPQSHAPVRAVVASHGTLRLR